MSNGCDGCPLKDDPNACKTMCARDHKRENDRGREYLLKEILLWII